MRLYWIDVYDKYRDAHLRQFLHTDEHVAFQPGDDESGEPSTLWIGGMNKVQIEFEHQEVEVTERDEMGREVRRLG